MSQSISTLIIKHLFGVIAPHEKIELDKRSAESEQNRKMIEKYTNKKLVLEEVKSSEELLNEKDWQKIQKNLHKKSHCSNSSTTNCLHLFKPCY